MSNRFLVTGAAGFIGSGVVHALLNRGDEVIAFDSGAAAGFAYIERSSAHIVRADIRDDKAMWAALEGCTAIVHLAAQASVPESIARPLEDLEINVAASLSLLEAARRVGGIRVVFASSNAVVGGHAPPAHEGQVPYPVSPYGAAKASIEAYLRAYGAAYGLEAVALRFANAYGPCSAHKSSAVSAFVKAYLAGGPLTIRGTGAQTRDFVYLDDIVSVVLACLDAPGDKIRGEVFQVGTGRETSLNELVAMLFEVGGEAVAVTHLEPSPGDVPRNVSDISKARRVLGYEPQTALKDGLRRTVDWFRSHSARR